METKGWRVDKAKKEKAMGATVAVKRRKAKVEQGGQEPRAAHEELRKAMSRSDEGTEVGSST